MGTINDPYTYMRHYWQGSINDDLLIYSGGDDFINGREGFDKLIISSSIDNFLIYTNYENITYLIDLEPVKGDNSRAFITTTDIEEVVFIDSSVTLSAWPDNFRWIYTDDYQYASHSRSGSSVNDMFDYIGGSDYIDGGDGSDAISLHSFSQEATIRKSSDVIFINFNNHEVYGNGSLILNNIEKIFFRDGEVSTDNLTYKSVDSINPTLSSFSPADNATAVATTSNIVLNFSEAVDVETGNIVIYKASNNSVVETIDVTSNQVTGSGSTQITVNPSNDLADQTQYYVQISATAFDDIYANSYAGISDKTTFSFTTADETSPSLSSVSPADNTKDFATNSNIVLNFSEAVNVETGHIVIYKASDDSVVETIDVTSSQVTGSGSTQITINPINDFAVQTEFYVQIDATALVDKAGNSYAGISDKTSLSFTTESAKIVLGKLSKGIIYSYDNEISGSNQLKYTFSVDGNLYPYFTLSGMSSDLDLDIYEVTTTVSGQRNSTLIKSSQNAGIESEFLFKALDTGNYEVLITPYENNTNETINFNFEIDNKSFEQNTNLPNDPLFKDQWYLFNTGQADAIDNYDIFAPEAWKDISSSPKITVAVIDSGIDYNHIDLDDNIWINTGEIKNNNIDDDDNGYIDDYQGWDFYYQDNNPMDYTNHGTHVAGIIGAEGNNSIGISGVSWDIELMNLKVFSDSANEKGAKNIYDAVYYAADNGADVINLSLGANLGVLTDYVYPSITFEDFKQNAPNWYKEWYDSLKYASDKGITIIAALGNESDNTEIYSSIPADFSSEIPGMISVAAFDNKGDITYYSNYGNIASIGAPGGVTYIEDDPNGILSTVINNEYKYMQGTSMAAPIVAGAAALIIEKDPTLTPEEVKEKILMGGTTLKDLENIVANGRFLDLDGSLQLVSSTQDISEHSIGNFYNLKGIKDFDGYHHANSGKVSDAVKNAYKYQGLLDVNADGTKEAIYTNKESGRWVTASINSEGEIDYLDYGSGGTTRVVGIYIDPLVTSGEVEQFGPHDSQRRFQNDLKIDNLIAKTSGDYDGDGFQEVYWKTNDGTAYLRALMHADGNIQYANYQNEEQMSDYLTSKGYADVISDII